ncbi:MAG TPA: hypothetical protein VGM04_02275, partial [Sphingomicrobium sp.]
MKRWLCLVAVFALPSPAAAAATPEYRIVARLPAGDGGWDLLSVAPADQRLYIAHGDRVTAIDLRT